MFDHDKVILEFGQALRDAGLILSGPPIMDGKMHRVPVLGERAGKTGGSYLGHLNDWPAGYINNWRTGTGGPWKASTGLAAARGTMPRPDPAAMRERQAAKAAKTARRQEAAARYAERLFEASSPSPSHPYLAKKQVGAHGTRISKRRRLLIPLRDAAGKLWSVQAIAEDDSKKFLHDGRLLGCFHTIGTPDGGPLLIAEGYATAATLHELLGVPVLVAFMAANLVPVAQAARAQWPEALIIVAGDDDGDNRRDPTGRPIPNVGKLKAAEAAEAVAGRSHLPTFPEGCIGTDWNDLHITAGEDAVTEQWHSLLGAGS